MGPLPLIVAAFLLGMTLPWAPPPLVCAIVSASLVGVALVARARGIASSWLLLAAALLAGGARRSSLEVPVWPRVPVAEAALARGRVLDGCATDGDRDRCVVEVDGFGRSELHLPPGRCAAMPGDVIEAVVTARAIVPMRNPPRDPSGLSRVLKGLRWTLDSAACEVVARRASPMDLVRRAALVTRRALEASLAKSLSVQHASRARALLFGDRTGLDAREHEAFRETGMAHLLAVSGAHVSLLLALTGAVMRALLTRARWLAVRGIAPRVAGILPLPLVGFFVVVTGEAPSSLRALLTATITALATLSGRRAHGESAVALVALVMAARDPSLVVDVGWVLSVVASWALARGSSEPAQEASPSLGSHLRSELVGALSASVRVGIAVTPALAWHFGRAPLTATVMNAVAAPVGEALLLPAVLVAAALGALLPLSLATLLGTPVGGLLGVLFALPSVAMRLPFASIATPAPTPAEWIVATVFAVASCGRSLRQTLALVLACALSLGALEAIHRHGLHPHGALRITAIDVGQGDAIVVELPDGEAMLVDGGGALTGGPDPGAREVVPWLALRRRDHLVAVVLSHPHPDHAGGLPAVLRALRVDALWDTGQGRSLGFTGAYGETLQTASEKHVPVIGPGALCGPPRRFHGAWIEVLAPCPSALDETPPNDASFVIRITVGRASALLPGDLERAGESLILSQLGRVDVLKVGHHGSATSSSDAFLDVLRPRVALVSAGHPSPFGHPHPAVLAAMRRHGVDLRRTDLSGAVTVTLRPDGGVE